MRDLVLSFSFFNKAEKPATVGMNCTDSEASGLFILQL